MKNTKIKIIYTKELNNFIKEIKINVIFYKN